MRMRTTVWISVHGSARDEIMPVNFKRFRRRMRCRDKLKKTCFQPTASRRSNFPSFSLSRRAIIRSTTERVNDNNFVSYTYRWRSILESFRVPRSQMMIRVDRCCITLNKSLWRTKRIGRNAEEMFYANYESRNHESVFVFSENFLEFRILLSRRIS